MEIFAAVRTSNLTSDDNVSTPMWLDEGGGGCKEISVTARLSKMTERSTVDKRRRQVEPKEGRGSQGGGMDEDKGKK
jgi:hypothetical protein